MIILKTEEKIKNIIDDIRPYLIADGGNLEFVKYEDGIEAMLINEIPEVKSVVQIED